MKKLSFLIMATMLALVSCSKKADDVNVELVTVENEVKTIGSTQAYFECKYEYINEITKALLVYCEDDQLKYAQTSKLEQVDGKWITQMNYLEKKTKYYYRYEFYNGYNLMWTEISDFTTLDQNIKPTVETVAVDSITMSSATVEGNVTNDGGSAVTDRGICFGIYDNPTLSDSIRHAGTGVGPFTCEMSNLSNATTYYIRAFATNSEGTSYGRLITIRTKEHPVLASVATGEVTNISINTASCSGNVTNDGGAEVTERGICYGLSENPSLSDSVRYAGTGTGRFTCEMTNLNNATTYYVRAFATNSEGTSYGEIATFRTIDHPVLATVTTDEVSEISINTAVCGGNVLDDGYSEITERGICYATHQQPTVFDYKVEGGHGLGLFQCRMSGLVTMTTYYVRAYAKNSEGYAYGNEVNFVTADETFLPEVITHEITDFNHFYAVGSGEVVSNGGLDIIERGICWSTSHNPTTTNNKLTSGTGMGEYSCRITYLFGNTTYYVRAFAANAAGMVYGNEVSFTTLPHPNTAPEGAIPSLFSISSSQQVFFSQGNLQYQASTNTWRFAEHQYDFVGGTTQWSSEEVGNVFVGGVKCSNNDISSAYSGWIDLFGWATSGWDDNNQYYHPWDVESTGWPVNGYGYGYWDGEYACYNMTGDYANSDWGVYNPVSNGGNEAGIWRTLNSGEWWYLVNNRQDATYKRSLATVNGVTGVVLLPDAWIQPGGVNFFANTNDYQTNTYNIEQWTTMENAGAVFFPDAGDRYLNGGDVVYYHGSNNYWSSTGSNSSSYSSNQHASYADLPNYPNSSKARNVGCSVRLVQNY